MTDTPRKLTARDDALIYLKDRSRASARSSEGKHLKIFGINLSTRQHTSSEVAPLRLTSSLSNALIFSSLSNAMILKAVKGETRWIEAICYN